MSGPDYLILIGAITLFIGELWAALDARPGNTISERVWWLTGKGRAITPWFLASRIFVLGFVAWLFLHFGGVAI